MRLRSRRAEDLTIKQIISLLQFRRAREVIYTSIEHYDRGLCPTCKTPPNIEYSKFCVGCGQKLSWNNYYKRSNREDWEKINSKYRLE